MKIINIHTKSALFGAGIVVLVGVLSAQSISNRFVAVRVLETPTPIQTNEVSEWIRIEAHTSGAEVTYIVPPGKTFVAARARVYATWNPTACGGYVRIKSPAGDTVWEIIEYKWNSEWRGHDVNLVDSGFVAMAGDTIASRIGCGVPGAWNYIAGYLVDNPN